MHWQQLVLIILTTAGGVVNLLKNGETRKYSFSVWLFNFIILYTLLITGGFFSH